MKSVKTLTFKAELVMEYGYKAEVDSLGKYNCSMELRTKTGNIKDCNGGDIEWITNPGKKNEEVIATIGVYWEGITLSDYDGIFSLPAEAIKLLRSVGIIVPKDFE